MSTEILLKTKMVLYHIVVAAVAWTEGSDILFCAMLFFEWGTVTGIATQFGIIGFYSYVER